MNYIAHTRLKTIIETFFLILINTPFGIVQSKVIGTSGTIEYP